MQDTRTPSDETVKPTIRRGRWILSLIVIAAVLIAFRMLPLENVGATFREGLEGLGVFGPIVLVVAYVIATVLFVPGTILTLVAGAVYGLGIGFVIVSVGSTIGASLAFLIARYAARDQVVTMANGNRHFSAIDRAIADGGWKIVALLRLSPAIPFNMQNYLYGLTKVQFWPYAITSWIAMMPGTFLYVYLGHVTGAALGRERERSVAEWTATAVGLLATLVVTIYITKLARQKLNESASHQNAIRQQKPG